MDVGNTHTVLGIYKGEKIEDHWRLTTRKETTSDEVLNRVGGLIRFSKIKLEEISYVGLSTVVPVLERPWVKALQKLLKKLGLLRNSVQVFQKSFPLARKMETVLQHLKSLLTGKK